MWISNQNRLNGFMRLQVIKPLNNRICSFHNTPFSISISSSSFFFCELLQLLLLPNMRCNTSLEHIFEITLPCLFSLICETHFYLLTLAIDATFHIRLKTELNQSISFNETETRLKVPADTAAAGTVQWQS